MTSADSCGQGDSGGGSVSEAEEPLRKRLERGRAEVRLMLPTPLPRSIPLDLAPSPAWPQGLPCHPDSLAWAVVPYSPTAPLAELAGMPADSGSAGSSSPGRVRRLALRFDHQRPLPDVNAGTPQSAAAAPSVLIEELPLQTAQTGGHLAAAGGYDAMEE